YAHGDLRRELLGPSGRFPRLGMLDLLPTGSDFLPEVTLAAHQGNADHGDAQVGRRAQRIAGQAPETAAVRGNLRAQPDLHAEVANPLRVQESRDARPRVPGRGLHRPHHPFTQITGSTRATSRARPARSETSTTSSTSLYAAGASSATPRKDGLLMKMP